MRDLVVALHCSGSSARQWRALAERLEPTCRFVAMDLHGHGVQPPWPGERPMTLADEAALIAPLIARHHADARPRGAADGSRQDEPRAPRVHLIGHSYGGAVALKVASQHPGFVHSVAVYEPVLFRLLVEDRHSTAELRDAVGVADTMRRSHARGDDVLAAQSFVDYWSGPGTWVRLAEARRAASAAQVRDILAQFWALFNETALPAALARLHPPTLVLTGGQTVATARRIGELLRTPLSAARHETLAGLAHMGPITHAEQVNQRLVAFLHEAGAAVDAFRVPPPGRLPTAPNPVHGGAARRFSHPLVPHPPQLEAQA